MIENTEENNAVVMIQIERFSTKRGWSGLPGARFELARVAVKYARDLAHLEATITDMCEEWPQCPDSRELKQELIGIRPGDLPKWEPPWEKDAKPSGFTDESDPTEATDKKKLQ